MTVPGESLDRGFSKLTHGSLVAILLTLFALQVIFTSRQMSPASDENAALPLGYLFLETGQWGLVPEHPPLIFALSAIPLLVLKPHLDFKDPNLHSQPANVWRFGGNFFSSNNPDQLLFWGRLPVLLISLLLGYFVYRWANELYGG